MLSWFILLLEDWNYFLLFYNIIWVYLKTLCHFTSSYLDYMLFLGILFLNQFNRYSWCNPWSFSIIIPSHSKRYCFWCNNYIVILILAHLWLYVILLAIILKVIKFRNRFFSIFFRLFNVWLVIVVKSWCNTVLNMMALHLWSIISYLSCNLSLPW